MRYALSDFSYAVGAKGKGASKYVSIDLPGGASVVIRISNHNANANTFAERGYLNDNISIVFKSAMSGNKFISNKSVNLIEYVYTSEAVAKDGNLLSSVAEKLSDMLITGKYEDDRAGVLVNKSPSLLPSSIQRFMTSFGEVYGFVRNGKIYLDPNLLNANTPIHEYTHLWDAALRKVNPQLWERGKELMRQLPLWEEVRDNPAYADIRDDEDRLASEVHARLSGRSGDELLDRYYKSRKTKSLVGKIKAWLRDVLSWVRDAFSGRWGHKELESLTLEEFAAMPVSSLARGLNPNDVVASAVQAYTEERRRAACACKSRRPPLRRSSRLITAISLWLQPACGNAEIWHLCSRVRCLFLS